jgi:hypothetical protein
MKEFGINNHLIKDSNLIYRATRDGDNIGNFFNKCNGIQNIILILKSNNNCIFGGFTKVGFKKVESFYKESLPQLGWIYQGTYNDTIVFYRDGESLSFFKESTKPLGIRITVKNRL